MWYFISIPIYILLYIGVVFLFRYFKNTFLTNLVFSLLTLVPYLCLMLIVYSQVGGKDWNFLNTLPTANVSPFMFSTCFIYLILPKKIKSYYFLLISLLTVGMLVAPIVNMIHFGAIDYKYHGQFVLDYLSHFSLSLWGIYLIYSKQIELRIKKSLISGSIILGVAIIMLILNVIFDQSFFGLSLNGKHTIYNVKFVDNSYLSAVIYFAGLIVVLILGYIFQFLINKLLKKNNEQANY